MRMPTVFALVVLSAASARAHEQLDAPMRRYDEMKDGPCGRGVDDGRTGRFTRYQAGERITVKWRETVDHLGSWRVAFDDDGADRADFDGNVLLTMDDPSNESGKAWEAQVTLPNVECGNCTLQLMQVMTPGQPADSDLYHQCADVVLGGGPSADAQVGCRTSRDAPLLAFVVVLSVRANGRRRGQRRAP